MIRVITKETKKNVAFKDIPPYSTFTGEFHDKPGIFFKGIDVVLQFTTNLGEQFLSYSDMGDSDRIVKNYEPANVEIKVL